MFVIAITTLNLLKARNLKLTTQNVKHLLIIYIKTWIIQVKELYQ